MKFSLQRKFSLTLHFSLSTFHLFSKSLFRKVLLCLIKVVRGEVDAARVDGVVHLLLGGTRKEEDEALTLNEICAVKHLLYALGVGLRAGKGNAVEAIVDRLVKALHAVRHKGKGLEFGIVILKILL